MTDQYEFDHLSIGVRQPLDVARNLRRELGAEPLVGGVLPQFRYLLMHMGDVSGGWVRGGRLELISTPDDSERCGTGFMHRFLERHGESAHHLSFNVPSLPLVREELRAAGFRTVQEDLDFQPWQEIFLPPDTLHGVVIQVASTTKPLRTRDLFGTRERDWAALPNNRDVMDPGWWEELWDVPVPGPTGGAAPGPSGTRAMEQGAPSQASRRAVLGPVVLGTTDLDRSDVLFREILHGTPGQLDDVPGRAHSYTWPTGALVVMEGEPGVRGAVCVPPAGRRETGPSGHGPDRHVGSVRFSTDLEDLR